MLNLDEVEEVEEKQVRYLKCARCTINIGPGHLQKEVWYDPNLKKPICSSCGIKEEFNGSFKILSEQELIESKGGATLVRLINSRKRNVRIKSGE